MKGRLRAQTTVTRNFSRSTASLIYVWCEQLFQQQKLYSSISCVTHPTRTHTRAHTHSCMLTHTTIIYKTFQSKDIPEEGPLHKNTFCHILKSNSRSRQFICTFVYVCGTDTGNPSCLMPSHCRITTKAKTLLVVIIVVSFTNLYAHYTPELFTPP